MSLSSRKRSKEDVLNIFDNFFQSQKEKYQVSEQNEMGVVHPALFFKKFLHDYFHQSSVGAKIDKAYDEVESVISRIEDMSQEEQCRHLETVIQSRLALDDMKEHRNDVNAILKSFQDGSAVPLRSSFLQTGGERSNLFVRVTVHVVVFVLIVLLLNMGWSHVAEDFHRIDRPWASDVFPVESCSEDYDWRPYWYRGVDLCFQGDQLKFEKFPRGREPVVEIIADGKTLTLTNPDELNDQLQRLGNKEIKIYWSVFNVVSSMLAGLSGLLIYPFLVHFVDHSILTVSRIGQKCFIQAKRIDMV